MSQSRGNGDCIRRWSVLGKGDSPVMFTSGRYLEELIDRGIWMVFESGRPIAHVAADLRIPSETLRKRVRQAEIDEGRRQGLSTAEREEIRKLRKETAELRRPIQIGRSEPVHREHRGRFGVEPICRIWACRRPRVTQRATGER